MTDRSGHSSRRSRPSRSSGADALCLALVLAGVVALFQAERAGRMRVVAPAPRAGGAVAADDAPILPAPDGSGLRLPAGARFRLAGEDGARTRHDRIAFEVRPLDPAARIDLLVRWSDARGDRVRLAFLPQVSAALWSLDADGTPRRLEAPPAATRDPPAPAAADGTRRIVLHLEGAGLSVDVDGVELLRARETSARAGAFELHAVDGAVQLTAVDVRGRRVPPDGPEQPFLLEERFAVTAPGAPDLAVLARAGARVLLLWLAGALFLSALAAGAAAPAACAAAACRLLAPSAAVLLAATALRLPSAEMLAAAVAPLGLLAAWIRLGDATRTGLAARAPRRRATAWLAVAALCGGTAWTVAVHEHGVLSRAAALEQEARRAPARAPHRAPGPHALGPDGALVAPGPWTDVRVRTTVTLEDGASLAVRLRAPDPSVAEGVLAVLPADARLQAALYHEDPMYLWMLGDPAPPLPPGRPLAVEITSSGRTHEVRVDGALRLRAESLEPVAGDVVLLAHHGRLTLADLEVEALPAAPPRDAAGGAALAALTPLGVLAAFALAAGVLLRMSRLVALHAGAFALLPLLALLLTRPDGASPGAASLHDAALAGAALLAAVAVTRLRVAPVRALALAAGGAALLSPAIARSVHPGAAVDADLMSRISYLQWPGTRLHEDLLHLEHPLFRRWNHYLARHAFRDRDVALRKAPGLTRVVALGGSGTWGWRLESEDRQDWPAALQDMLVRRDADAALGAPPRWEVVNAAYVGATSGRLFRLFRDVLLDYAPDVVVLSVYYNDAPALSQGDEEAYLARVTAPDYERGWWDDWTERRRRAREAATMQAMLGGPMRRDDAAEAWRAAGAEGWPPDRFAASLRRYAELARAHGIRLVLVKEPIAGDGPFLWKREFHEAMERVGAEEGVTVVDPSPALQAAGGRKLFMDDVHLTALGHRIVAGVLEPVVRGLVEGDR